MNAVKDQILKSLQFAIEQCNLADVTESSNPDCVNDLPDHASYETFNHLRGAIISLTSREVFTEWCESGEWVDVVPVVMTKARATGIVIRAQVATRYKQVATRYKSVMDASAFPLTAAINLARLDGIHNIPDGSDEYNDLLKELELLLAE